MLESSNVKQNNSLKLRNIYAISYKKILPASFFLEARFLYIYS